MMWFFNCSKIANGCNISFNCHFIISYVARFWNHHERRLLKVHQSITFSIYLLLIQTLFETNSSFNLYKVLLYTYGWLDGACLGQKEISNGGWRGGGGCIETYPSNNSMSELIFEWFHLMIAGIIRQWGQIWHSFIRGLQKYLKISQLISTGIASGLYEQYDCHFNVFPCWQDKIRDMALKIKS